MGVRADGILPLFYIAGRCSPLFYSRRNNQTSQRFFKKDKFHFSKSLLIFCLKRRGDVLSKCSYLYKKGGQ